MPGLCVSIPNHPVVHDNSSFGALSKFMTLRFRVVVFRLPHVILHTSSIALVHQQCQKIITLDLTADSSET